LLGIALATIPIVAVGLLLKKRIETNFRSLWVIAGALGGFALLLAYADRVASRPRRSGESLGIRDAVFVGIAQTFALVPGASRSGTTMTGAFLLGLDRPTAARFSFILSIPAVAGAGLYELAKEWHALRGAGLGPLVVATVVSGIVGYLALDALLRYLRTRSAMPFVVYRLALAALLAVLLLSGRLSAGSPIH
jgi:undecaprenyl-diphosphatase